MGNATAVKGMDLAAMTASVKASGTQQTGKMDDGFQKLLDSKSGEESKGNKTSDSKKTDDTKDAAKKPENDKVQEKPGKQEKPEETVSVEDSTALEQAQAALLFQIVPQDAGIQEEEEPQEELLAIGALAVEEILPEEVSEELPGQEVKNETPAVGELFKESDEDVQKLSKGETEKIVLPADTQEEPEVEVSLEKPVKQVSKDTSAPEKKADQGMEQMVQNVRPETHEVEAAPQKTEVPTEYIRVQQPEEIPEKILDQLLVKTVEGQKEFEVQLEPYDLGKIMIRVAFGKEATTVSIVCTEPKTMELMAKNAREIGAIMEENLGSPTTIVVEEKETGYLEQQRQGNGGNAGQNQEQESGKQNQKDRQSEGSDFLQQLRLGLI